METYPMACKHTHRPSGHTAPTAFDWCGLPSTKIYHQLVSGGSHPLGVRGERFPPNESISQSVTFIDSKPFHRGKFASIRLSTNQWPWLENKVSKPFHWKMLWSASAPVPAPCAFVLHFHSRSLLIILRSCERGFLVIDFDCESVAISTNPVTWIRS